MTINVRPIGDRILVEPIEEKEQNGKKGGIIIPDTAKEKPMESMVVAVGTGKTGDDGKKIFLEVKKGDRVLVSKYGGKEIKLNGKEYRIFNGNDVLAIIDNYLSTPKNVRGKQSTPIKFMAAIQLIFDEA